MVGNDRRVEQEADGDMTASPSALYPCLSFRGPATADIRALCRLYISTCLGDEYHLDKRRQHRAESIVSELLLNIAVHGRRNPSDVSRTPGGCVEIKMAHGELSIATEAVISDDAFRRVDELVKRYSGMDEDERVAEERSLIVRPDTEGRGTGLGLGLLSVVSSSKTTTVNPITREDRLYCRIEAVL
jgi:anti-sigma regulatory factor (Ser/Thr protein kinase)